MSSTLLAINRGLRKDSALLVHLAQDLASNPTAKPREKFTFNVLELATGSLRKLAGRAPAGAGRGAPARARVGDIDAVLQDDDHDLLVVDDRDTSAAAGVELPPEIFRAYDIRGVVGKNLTKENVELIGRAIGTEALAAGQQTVIVARDGRLSGPDLSRALIAGIIASGRNVIDLGMVPTPVLYYATKVLGAQSGVCLTGSHNPPNENGLKIVINNETLHGERIQALRERVARGDLSSGKGTVQEQEVASRYLNEIVNDIVLARPMKVAIDTANGVTGKLAPELLRQLGCEVVELFTDIDGNFPNHSPDTSKPDNYKALIEAVQSQQAEIGIALDGDGDRIGVVTPKGEIIWADRLMMLFARDLLNRTPGADIIFDVKCSRELAKLISQHGGRPLMWKTGHSLIKAKLKETGAPLAGEMSGHIFFNDRWHGFDDGMYSMTRLLEILSLESADADAVFAGLKTGVATPEISIPVTDQSKFPLIEKLQAKAGEFSDGSAVTIDGLRVDFEDGWGLVRASNTGPTLVARFEGTNDAALTRIKDQFKQQLLAINPQLRLPF
ncbi:MAG: phosphomannomutase/phosphoglucomutase [Alcanivoracaceae bacterium]|nr:phosphomannomutase/phosphoglucomutase [Alcanivoracaceae bacterium]